MARSACLIFNPIAGQGNPEQDLSQIQALLSPEFDLQISLTTEDIGADELAAIALAQAPDLILASGGDGTLSAVAAALVGTGVPLGVISRGTANAFANALGIPDRIDLACQTILAGVTRTVDAALCNGQPMILLAGVGFEAETVAKADRESKSRLGTLAYILAGVDQLRNFDWFEVQLETDEEVITTSAAAVTIANAAPPTSILAQGPAGVLCDDGLLDVTVVAPETIGGAIAVSYSLLQSALRGTAVERNDVGYLRTKRLKVTTTPPQKVVVDGELMGTTPIEVECIPAGLTVFVPPMAAPPPIKKLEGLPNLVIEPRTPDTETNE